jgi:two-component system, NarL family, response regulator DevR
MAGLRVFLVDEHEIVRRGVAAIVGDEDDMTIVGEASNVPVAPQRVRAAKPDVVVMELSYTGHDGVALCRDLLATPGAHCLCLTAVVEDEILMHAFLAGASGVLDKTISASELVSSIRSVADGRSLLDPRAAGVIMNRLSNAPKVPSQLAVLSAVEFEVLKLIGEEGLTNKQIAVKLYIADKTVKNNISSILRKLHVASRTQAALIYRAAHGKR